MKTLATCTPREFLVQTNKIRKNVANWLTLTGVLDIRKKAPVFTDDMTDSEKKAAARAQAKKNIEEMMDRILEEHPAETAELLGLVCFIEPEDLDNHSMMEILGAAAEILNSPEVVDFFISLANWEKIGGSIIARV